MYFGLYKSELGVTPELCLIPEKMNTGFYPLMIKDLIQTSCAMCFLSNEEATNIIFNEEGAVVVTPLKPAKLYLTPNRPEKPGFSVTKIKIHFLTNNTVKVFYDRDKGWEEFTPSKKDY